VTSNTTPRFTHSEAVQIGHELFGVTATAAALPSERDQNFLLSSGCGKKYVLKIAKSDEDRAALEFQNAALRHVVKHAPQLTVPRVQPTRSGEDLTQIGDARGRAHYVRLIGWLDGQMLADCAVHDESLLTSLGATMGNLAAALQGFTHSAMHRELHWDVRHADLALKHLPLLASPQQLIVRKFMQAWSDIDWRTLRHSVIHGDANDHNVLVREGLVVGLIDFGDIVHSAVVCDLAIAVAYAMLDKPRPLSAASTILNGYHDRCPLQRAELDALFPLVTARLCMSVCYAAYNARVRSGDAYQQVTAAPAWTLLQKLAVMVPSAVRDAWRDACGI
jgi:Ser/Thr protein kinase RdoA (MazF antagonist)